MRKRNQHGNCGVVIIILAAIICTVGLWMWIAMDDADKQRCDEIKTFYSYNPYDSNPEIQREYEQVCHV